MLGKRGQIGGEVNCLVRFLLFFGTVRDRPIIKRGRNLASQWESCESLWLSTLLSLPLCFRERVRERRGRISQGGRRSPDQWLRSARCPSQSRTSFSGYRACVWAAAFRVYPGETLIGEKEVKKILSTNHALFRVLFFFRRVCVCVCVFDSKRKTSLIN